MTAGQAVAWVRDVPVSCVCEWTWRGPRLVRVRTNSRCWWHGGTS